ncbi:MAG: hypothetical protein C4336_01015 [Armatimonadota bacterium]
MKRLSEPRARIDEIDKQLLALLNERAELAKAIGEIKTRDQRPFFTPEREQIIYLSSTSEAE